jgi:ABC-type uncharacterized transport system ATPase subunit
MPEQNESVVVENLVKRFGDFVAVDRINLEVSEKARFLDSLDRTGPANPPPFACFADC